MSAAFTALAPNSHAQRWRPNLIRERKQRRFRGQWSASAQKAKKCNAEKRQLVFMHDMTSLFASLAHRARSRLSPIKGSAANSV
jgi:hypothetical protein